jgi:hypothetical protein
VARRFGVVMIMSVLIVLILKIATAERRGTLNTR